MVDQPETKVETRSAPAWAWGVIDGTMKAIATGGNFDGTLCGKAYDALTIVTGSPKSQAEYIDDPGSCPCCGSDQIEGGSLDHYGGGVSQDISCLECGARWGDIHQLARYELTKGPDAEEA